MKTPLGGVFEGKNRFFEGKMRGLGEMGVLGEKWEVLGSWPEC